MPIVDLVLDSSGALTGAQLYDSAADKVENSTEKIIKSTKGASGGFSSLATQARSALNVLGTIAIASAGAAAVALIGVTKNAIQLASNLEETQNKFDVVFKGMTEQAEAWATNLQENYMMTTEESKRFLAGTQDLLKPLGIAAGEAGKMSFEIAKLSGDLGSFNNLPTAQVMDDLNRAMVGEYESMKKYGVVLNDTIVRQQAVNMGLAASTQQVDAAAKATAALTLIQQSSKDAIGDMERSAGSYANQMKLLHTQITNIVTQFGTALLPLATEIVTTINQWLSKQENLNLVLSTSIEILRGLYNGWNGIILVLKGVIVAVAKTVEYMVKGFNMVLSPISKLFDALISLGWEGENPLTQLQTAVEDFSASAVESFQNTWTKVEEGNKYFDGIKARMLETGNAMQVVQEEGKKIADTTQKITNTTENMAAKTAYAWQIVKNAAGEYEQVLVTVDKKTAEQSVITGQLAANTATATTETKKNTEAAKQNAQANQAAAASLGSVSAKANQAAASYANLTNQQSAASSTVGAGGGGGGATAGGPFSSGGGGTTSTMGVVLPSYFTQAMARQYNEEMLKYLTNQDYIWNPGVRYGPLGSANPGEAQRADSNPGDPASWAARRYGSDYINQQTLETDLSTNAGGVTVNVNQQMSSTDVSNLVEELRRLSARA